MSKSSKPIAPPYPLANEIFGLKFPDGDYIRDNFSELEYILTTSQDMYSYEMTAVRCLEDIRDAYMELQYVSSGLATLLGDRLTDEEHKELQKLRMVHVLLHGPQ